MPDTLLYKYALNFGDKQIELTTTLSLRVDFDYWFNLHNKINFGVGYTYSLNNLVNGNYILFDQTQYQSTGNWKLRGNAFNVGITYQCVFYKKNKTK